MRRILFIAVIVIASSACGEGGIVVNITDAPVDEVSAVNLRVTGVELQRGDGNVERLDFADRDIPLLALTAGDSRQLLRRDDIAAGDFSGVRLLVEADGNTGNSSVTPNTGGSVPLQLSGGDLLARRDFSIDDEETITVTVDVDLRRSLRAPTSAGGNYVFAPALRLVQDNQAGRIAGRVDGALATAEGCDAQGGSSDIGNVVYVFEGEVTPDDLDGVIPEPVSSARAVLDAESGFYDYTAAFLPAGTYTVAFTCQGEFDELTRDDAIDFGTARTETVTAGQAVTVDFSAP